MSFGDIWKQAGQDDWEPPAGMYTVAVTEGSAFESRDGRQFCKLRLRVTKGAFEGNEFEHFMGFGSAIAARISRQSLVMYGLDGDAISDFFALEQAVERLRGVRAEVQVKHKDGYVNVDVVRGFTGQSDVPSDGSLFEHAATAAKPANAITRADDDELPY